MFFHDSRREANNAPEQDTPQSPKEARKDRWSRKVVEALVKTKFSLNQDSYIFNPHPEGVDKLKHPNEYQELKPYNVTERTLVTDTKLGRPTATITLWEKKAEPGKPHVIYFSGRTGHIADTGPDNRALQQFPSEIIGYNPHAGLKFLDELAKSGAGFTVVTLSGYGSNKGKPGEKAFRRDIKALVDDWKRNPNKVPSDQLIIAGYSLGTFNATVMASELSKEGIYPALLALGNGFSSMIRRGKEFIDENLAMSKNKRIKSINIPEVVVEKDMLNHPLNTEATLAELRPATSVYIATSGQDKVINPEHGRRLEEAAKAHGINVMTELFPESGHCTMPVRALAQGILAAYERQKANAVHSSAGRKAIANEDAKGELSWAGREGSKGQGPSSVGL